MHYAIFCLSTLKTVSIYLSSNWVTHKVFKYANSVSSFVFRKKASWKNNRTANIVVFPSSLFLCIWENTIYTRVICNVIVTDGKSPLGKDPSADDGVNLSRRLASSGDTDTSALCAEGSLYRHYRRLCVSVSYPFLKGKLKEMLYRSPVYVVISKP